MPGAANALSGPASPTLGTCSVLPFPHSGCVPPPQGPLSSCVCDPALPPFLPHLWGDLQEKSLEHLRLSDRSSLLSEIQALRAQLRMTHLQNQEKLQQLCAALTSAEARGSQQEHQLRRQGECRPSCRCPTAFTWWLRWCTGEPRPCGLPSAGSRGPSNSPASPGPWALGLSALAFLGSWNCQGDDSVWCVGQRPCPGSWQQCRCECWVPAGPCLRVSGACARVKLPVLRFHV